MARLLIESGADVNQADQFDNTPLWVATFTGHDVVAKLLIDGGADVNQADTDGRTPVDVAAENGHEAVVKLLMDSGGHDGINRLDELD